MCMNGVLVIEIYFFSELIFIDYLLMTLMQLRVRQLMANLPLQDSQIILSVDPIDGRTPLHESLNCPSSDQCVLMPELAAVALPPMQFTIDCQPSTKHELYQLYVLAVSNSNSKIVFLGSVTVDFHQFYNSSFQNGGGWTFNKSLQHVKNQKGNVTYEVLFNYQTQNTCNHFRQKSTESFGQQETSSSDSFDDNLKELNRTLDSDHNSNSPINKTLIPYSIQKNAQFSESIIVEQIDLEDSDDDLDLNIQMNSEFSSRSSIRQAQQKNQKIEPKADPKKVIKQRLQQQKLSIQRYLNRLQESDQFLFSLQQQLRYFKE